MGSPGGHEVELKLELRPQDVALISSLKSLPNARVSAPKAEQIYSVYFDTPGHELRRTGFSLRVRHAGAKRLQTVKAVSGSANAALDRAEDEVSLVGALPDVMQIGDQALREKVGAALADTPLSPVFETTVLRTTRRIRTEKGGEIELAIDTGDVRANGHARPICEVELELKQGEASALYSIARSLSAKAPMRLLRLSKSDRGYALCGETIAPPQKAKVADLPGGAGVGDAFRASVASCLTQILANEPAVVEGREIEGLHQLRVALRRLRAALKIFAPLCDSPQIAALEDEIKALAQVCGDARDLDVFETELLPRGLAHLTSRRTALKTLQIAASTARKAAWNDVSARLADPRFTALVLDLAALSADGPRALGHEVKRRTLEEPAKAYAREALERVMRKCVKLGRKLEMLDDEGRHALRKRLKELRYSGEFFAGLFPHKAAKAYSKRLNALQDSFGALNDLATAQRLVAQLVVDTPPASPLTRAGTELVAWYAQAAEDARGQACEAWAKFAKHAPFWQEA